MKEFEIIEKFTGIPVSDSWDSIIPVLESIVNDYIPFIKDSGVWHEKFKNILFDFSRRKIIEHIIAFIVIYSSQQDIYSGSYQRGLETVDLFWKGYLVYDSLPVFVFRGLEYVIIADTRVYLLSLIQD